MSIAALCFSRPFFYDLLTERRPGSCIRVGERRADSVREREEGRDRGKERHGEPERRKGRGGTGRQAGEVR
eukprot:348419-Rhodomonas_salina.1